MNKINWKLRLLSVKFWIALVPALILVVQAAGAPFGYKWDFFVLNQQLAALINAVFGVLAIIGVVADPTTIGLSDSELAINRTTLKEAGNETTDHTQS